MSLDLNLVANAMGISRMSLQNATPIRTPILQTPSEAQVTNRREIGKNFTQGFDYTSAEIHMIRKLDKTNQWVNFGSHVIASNISAPSPAFILSSKKEQRDNGLLKFLTDKLLFPNNNETWSSLVYKTGKSLVKFGNAYWQVIKNKKGDIHSIYSVPAHSIRPVPYIDDKTGFLRHYFCQVSAYGDGTIKIDRVFWDDEMIHFKRPNDESELLGQSTLAPLFKNISFDIEGQTWLNQYISNAFSGGMIFEMKNSHRDIVERNRLQLKENLSGSSNAGRNMILEGDMRILSMGNKADAFPFRELKEINRDEILVAMGVPLSIAGLRSVHGDVNPQIIEAEEQAFLRNTIEHYQRIIFSSINQQLFRNILNNKDLSISNGVNRHFSAQRSERLVNSLLKVGVTPNEARDLLGKQPLDTEFGDTVVVATNNGILPQETFFNNIQIDSEIKQLNKEKVEQDLNNNQESESIEITETEQPSLKVSTQEGTLSVE